MSGDKKLFRVAVEGEVWVEAEDIAQASREALKAITMNRYEIGFYVYPMLPTDPKYVDNDMLESVPYNSEDPRTVGERLRALAATRAAAVPNRVVEAEESK